MNKTKISLFSRLYYSIAGFDKYKYFLRQSVGQAVLYLIMLSLVLGIVTLIPAINQYNKATDDFIANFDSKIPDFTFKDGKLEVSGEMPIIIDDGASTIIIDTSPDTAEAEKILHEYDTVILVTREKIIIKNYADRTTTCLISLQGLKLTRDDLKQSLPMMKPLGIIIFLFMGIFFICGKFISAFIISLFGRILNSVRGTGLSYRSIFKISVYSMTLPLLLCTFLGLLPINIHLLLPMLYNTIAAIYVYGVIDSIRKELNSSDSTDSGSTDSGSNDSDSGSDSRGSTDMTE